MDRLYSSFQIVDWLLQKSVTLIGTFQANRVGIPPETKKMEHREVNSCEVYWKDDGRCNISSYVVKTSKGKKNVLLLSTVEPLLGVTKDDKRNPGL